jgi:hypothetical protein
MIALMQSWVWEALTAGGTIAMAVATYALMRQNRRHYQEERRPICVLVPKYDTHMAVRDALLRAVINDDDRMYLISCYVKNVGTGPAINLKLIIAFVDKGGHTVPWELSPLGPGEKYLKDRELVCAVRLTDSFNHTDFEAAPDGRWDIWLQYQDVYGNWFHTRHSKGPSNSWTALGHGRAPHHD